MEREAATRDAVQSFARIRAADAGSNLSFQATPETHGLDSSFTLTCVQPSDRGCAGTNIFCSGLERILRGYARRAGV